MNRGSMDWKIFWSTTILLMAAVALALFEPTRGVTVAVIALLIGGAFWQARWVSRRFRRALTIGAERLEQWPEHGAKRSPGDQRWTAEFPEFVRRLEAVQAEWRARLQTLEARAQEHAESTQLLQAVLRTMVEGVIVVDGDQKVLFVNDAARSLMEFSTRDVISRPIWEVSRTPAVHEAVGEVLASRRQLRREISMQRSQMVIVLTAAALPRDPVPGAVLVLHDVTELRRLEAIRREFVANVSHELKTPLTSIQAYADTLLAGGTESAAQTEEFLGRIVSESERLHQIILDVIRLGKIESEPESFSAEEVDVAGVVHACLKSHTGVAESRGIQINHEPPGEPLVVWAEARELRTILDNLVDNALKYTPRGGRVCVRWYGEGGAGVIEVQDTGIGIPRSQQTRIFERFFRADRARDRERGGTGLGLSIVKHLCHLFGGSIEVESEMDQGSVFRVRLPRVGWSAPPLPQARPLTSDQKKRPLHAE